MHIVSSSLAEHGAGLMMEKVMAAPALREPTHISRPLKTLIPLIQSELQQGNNAGHEHYRLAGEMLIEAKEQVGHGGWNRWLSKNFELSPLTAQRYMRMARLHDEMRRGVTQSAPTSISQMIGDTERRREGRQSKQRQAFRSALRDVARDEFVQERQVRDQEIELHRSMAGRLIDLGYKALAMELHPDRGGTKEAMTRLNRVRDELRSIAQTRRFV